MTLPQNVADAVERLRLNAKVDSRDWYEINAHLLSQEAEISDLRADRDSWRDQASNRVADWDAMRLRADLAVSRLAAANALLRDVRDSYSTHPVLHARIQSHLQGAGDEA